MKKLVFTYNSLGGAFNVASNYSNSINADLINLSNISLNSFFKFVKDSSFVSFHQSRSYIYALLSLFYLNSSDVEIVIHESSLMSLRWSSPLSLLITASKYLLLRFLYFFGCSIKSVSLSVANSYNIPYHRFFLLPYIYGDSLPLSFQSSKWFEKSFSAVIFLRPYANDSILLSLIPRILLFFSIKDLHIIGLSPSTEKYLSLLRHFDVHTYDYLPRPQFLKLLSSSRLFFSPFRREGFGLSILESMLLGNIVFCPTTGACSEIVPLENFILCDMMKSSSNIAISRFDNIFSSISLNNSNHARNLISYECSYRFN